MLEFIALWLPPFALGFLVAQVFYMRLLRRCQGRADSYRDMWIEEQKASTRYFDNWMGKHKVTNLK